MSLLVSPCCKARLEALTCSACQVAYESRDRVPLLMDAPTRRDSEGSWFEQKHQREREPWDYSQRASELERYDFLFETASSLVKHRTDRIGDVGCASGLLATRLMEVSENVAAIDLSPTAVSKARDRAGSRLEVASASATALPFATGSMQLLVVADGLMSWGLSREQQRDVVCEVDRALAHDGHAMFMDFLNPRAHETFLAAISERFEIQRVAYLDDRLWWVAESAFRMLRGTSLYNAFAGSESWSRLLAKVSSLGGPRGSKHLCAVASKQKRS